MTRNRWIPGGIGLALFIATGLFVVRVLPASAIAPCVAHANSGEEQEWLQLHNTWRNQYIPGSDPSNPLVVSSTLNAAAAGYATYLADHAGTAGHSADGAESPPWSTRARLCGYPAGVAVGGEMISLVTNPTGP
ncbi:MAG: hypothetical protein ABI782_11265, partial [Anaerolineaceae bacterium]